MSKNNVGTNQLIYAYRQLGNVWKVGEKFGISGQSVHERLSRLKIIQPMNVWSEAELAVIRAEYVSHRDNATLDELAIRLGRTKQFVCRKARELGLTNGKQKKTYTKEAKARISGSLSISIKDHHKNNPHPRGMLGKTHTKENRKKVGEAASKRWHGMTEDERAATVLKGMKTRDANGTLHKERGKATWKSGWREIGGQRKYYRSRWEANYARMLEAMRLAEIILSWEHEPETFWFESIKRGCRSYLPDFRVVNPDGSVEYHEVKGWMDSRSATKIKRMAKYHPDIVLHVIGKKEYLEYEKDFAFTIEGWEHKRPLA